MIETDNIYGWLDTAGNFILSIAGSPWLYVAVAAYLLYAALLTFLDRPSDKIEILMAVGMTFLGFLFMAIAGILWRLSQIAT